MKATIFTLIIITGIIFNHDIVRAQPNDTTDYFPLQTDCKWIYLYSDVAPYYHADTSTITQSISINDTLYTVRYNTFFLTDYFRKDSNGNIFGRVSDRDQLLFDLNGNLGEVHSIEQVIAGNATQYLVIRISDTDEATTHAGRFRNCKKFEIASTGGFAMSGFIWLAPGVGIVERGEFITNANLSLRQFISNGAVVTPRVWHPFVVSPRENTIDVWLDSKIYFFYNSIPPSAIHEEYFTVSSKRVGTLQGNWQYGHDGWSREFVQAEPFPAFDTITVTISAALNDYFGDPLDGNGDWISDGMTSDDYRWTFCTGGTTGISGEAVAPANFSLGPNYPNPFNPETRIDFQLLEGGFTNLKIVDMLGREVAVLINGKLNPGSFSITFNGSQCSSGIYLLLLKEVGESGKVYSKTMKIQLIK